MMKNHSENDYIRLLVQSVDKISLENAAIIALKSRLTDFASQLLVSESELNLVKRLELLRQVRLSIAVETGKNTPEDIFDQVSKFFDFKNLLASLSLTYTPRRSDIEFLKCVSVAAKQRIEDNPFTPGSPGVTFELATGSGKTKLEALLIAATLSTGKKKIVVCHRRDLAEQLTYEMQKGLPNVSLTYDFSSPSSKYKKEFNSIENNPEAQVIFTVVDSFKESFDEQGNYKHGEFDLLVMDESHRYYAQDKVQNILNNITDHALITLFSATPYNFKLEAFPGSVPVRMGYTFMYVDSAKMPPNVLYQYNLAKGVSDGNLSPLQWKTLGVNSSFSDLNNPVSSLNEDYTSNQLDEFYRSTESDSNLEQIIGSYACEVNSDKHEFLQSWTMAKCHSIAVAEESARKVCIQTGLSTVVISSKGCYTYTIVNNVVEQTKLSRRDAVLYFESTPGKILFQVDTMTEGYDFPPISKLFTGFSVTTSWQKYIQFLGRGIRTDKNNPDKVLTVYDVHPKENLTFSPLTAPVVLGIPPREMVDGKSQILLEKEKKHGKDEDNNYSSDKVSLPAILDVFYRNFKSLDQVFLHYKSEMDYLGTSDQDCINQANFFVEKISKESNQPKDVFVKHESQTMTYNPVIIYELINWIELEYFKKTSQDSELKDKTSLLNLAKELHLREDDLLTLLHYYFGDLLIKYHNHFYILNTNIQVIKNKIVSLVGRIVSTEVASFQQMIEPVKSWYENVAPEAFQSGLQSIDENVYRNLGLDYQINSKSRRLVLVANSGLQSDTVLRFREFINIQAQESTDFYLVPNPRYAYDARVGNISVKFLRQLCEKNSIPVTDHSSNIITMFPKEILINGKKFDSMVLIQQDISNYSKIPEGLYSYSQVKEMSGIHSYVLRDYINRRKTNLYLFPGGETLEPGYTDKDIDDIKHLSAIAPEENIYRMYSGLDSIERFFKNGKSSSEGKKWKDFINEFLKKKYHVLNNEGYVVKIGEEIRPTAKYIHFLTYNFVSPTYMSSLLTCILKFPSELRGNLSPFLTSGNCIIRDNKLVVINPLIWDKLSEQAQVFLNKYKLKPNARFTRTFPSNSPINFALMFDGSNYHLVYEVPESQSMPAIIPNIQEKAEEIQRDISQQEFIKFAQYLKQNNITLKNPPKSKARSIYTLIGDSLEQYQIFKTMGGN